MPSAPRRPPPACPPAHPHAPQGLKGYDPTFSLQTKDGQKWSLANEVPYQLRAATGLLAALGRKPEASASVISGHGHYEYNAAEVEPKGIPHVELDLDEELGLGDLGATGEVRLNADTMTQALTRYFGREEFDRHVATIGWLFQPEKHGADWSDLPQINLRTFFAATESQVEDRPLLGGQSSR